MELFRTDRNLNPLLFPSILGELFQCLSIKELKQCRLVCRDWEIGAYRAMRGRIRISITNYKQVKTYICLEEVRKDFCDTFIFNSAINVETPLMSQLFREFGQSIKSLTLQKAKWRDSQLITLLFDRLPNLEKLTMDCMVPKPNSKGQFLYAEDSCGKRRILSKLKHLSLNATAWDTVDVSPSTTIKAFLNDFFAIAPNLEKIASPKPPNNYHPLEFLFPLDVAHIATFINGEVVDALDELSGLGFEANTRRVLFDNLVSTDARSPRLYKLAEIDINMILRDEHVRKLIFRGYPLQKLEMIVTQSVTLSNLHTLLRSIAQTLRNLSLRYLRRSTCSSTFPSAGRLNNLTHLSVTGYRGSFGFIRHFHNLERLVIVKVPKLCSAFPPQDLNFGNQLMKLHTLEIYEEESNSPLETRPAFIKTFPSLFPNLRRLRMDHMCDTSLKAVYKSIPHLKELVAKNGQFTDDGLTGVNLQCRIVIGSPYIPKAGRPKSRISSSIADLKDLTLLDLHSKQLSDFGILSGVVNCKRLKKLTLMSYKITDTAIRAIVDELELEYLKTEFCYQLTTELVDYVTEKMRGMEVSINEYEGPMNAMEMWKFLKRNNNMQIPITRMSNKAIEDCRSSLLSTEPQPSTSFGSSSRRH